MVKNYKELPVYEQKEKILESLAQNQVIVVQSPTGSGKTTQIPVILHEAGYSESGIIAVTQPRRIAALSVSEFISKQLGTSYPGLVGYKMRFEDKTDSTTKIKIMTDGILLQEMKLDPWLSKYSVIMVDEAHERSLNIDFVLGLLKRVLAERPDFKVIVSSATMNTEAFSRYFGGCPVVTIKTVTYPVTLIYDPPVVPASTASVASCEALLAKIESTIERILGNKEDGDILVFLPGEKIIKDCMKRLMYARFARKIYLVPLYGRLAKEEQERVFADAPDGRKKVVISTNIAETSVTIGGITSVIDSGLAKLNFYSPRTFTSSLNETLVSKASCLQRRGRAGRTCPGTCYRLYPRRDFEAREEYTLEEIYRTDLSEVVLQMAELGITEFSSFDFISPPGKEGIAGAVETLTLLKALNPDNTLSETGKLMVEFPLMPRISRIIVEAILHYPDVVEEAIIAAAFLSTQSPFVLPQGQETDARAAHHEFRDARGDFVSYVKIFRRYTASTNQEKFCESNFLDARVMAEIANIKAQLEEIAGDRLHVPIMSGGNLDGYLCCVASGMIQFVCVREGRENYRSLTAEHIQIHPGSVLFKTNPPYIVAGEIVRISRMFAMSVSPLTKNLLAQIDPTLEEKLGAILGKPHSDEPDEESSIYEKFPNRKQRKSDDIVTIGGTEFGLVKVNGKKWLRAPVEQFTKAVRAQYEEMRGSPSQLKSFLAQLGGLKGALSLKNGKELLAGEKLDIIVTAVRVLNLQPIGRKQFRRNLNINIAEDGGIQQLIENLPLILRVTPAKQNGKELGFICLFNNGKGTYWFKVSRGFPTALNESYASIERFIDETKNTLDTSQKQNINDIYRTLGEFYER